VEPRVITKTSYLKTGRGSEDGGVDNKGLEDDEIGGKEIPMKELVNEEAEDVNKNSVKENKTLHIVNDDESGKVTINIDAGI